MGLASAEEGASENITQREENIGYNKPKKGLIGKRDYLRTLIKKRQPDMPEKDTKETDSEHESKGQEGRHDQRVAQNNRSSLLSGDMKRGNCQLFPYSTPLLTHF